MKTILVALLSIFLLTAAWYFTWRSMMADDVANIEASIKHRHDIIKTASPHTTFKADAVYATGFPFRFRVAVHRPTLTQVWGNETYAISFEKLELTRANDSQFQVFLPQTFDSMYAIDGTAPEQYRIGLNEMPQLWLAGQSAGTFTQYGVQLPRKLVLDVTLNGQARQIGFDFPLQLPKPVFADMPADASRPLQIFVGMLREAMVFSK